MASKEEIELIMGKAILEPEFRKEFMNSPEAAAKKIGIELSPEQAKAFNGGEICAVAEQLDKTISKTNSLTLCRPY